MKAVYGLEGVTIIFDSCYDLSRSIHAIRGFRDTHPDLHIMILPAALQIGRITNDSWGEVARLIGDLEFLNDKEVKRC